MPLTHHPMEDEIHHVIFAGTKFSSFRPKLNKDMNHLPCGGSHGTLELHIKTNPRRKEAVIYREVPEEHQGKGIGTDLLKAAEKVAKEHGAELISAWTKNPRAVKSYKRAGWKLIKELPNQGYIYGKDLREKKS